MLSSWKEHFGEERSTGNWAVSCGALSCCDEYEHFFPLWALFEWIASPAILLSFRLPFYQFLDVLDLGCTSHVPTIALPFVFLWFWDFSPSAIRRLLPFRYFRGGGGGQVWYNLYLECGPLNLSYSRDWIPTILQFIIEPLSRIHYVLT